MIIDSKGLTQKRSHNPKKKKKIEGKKIDKTSNGQYNAIYKL